MELNETFKFYGYYNISNILRILDDNKLDWNEFIGRQKACFEMVNTQTIKIVYENNFFNTNFNPVFTKNYVYFEEDLNNICEIIKKQTDCSGYLLRAILVKLYKKSTIPNHVDTANGTFEFSRRIHVPIITNENCIFNVGEESINMKVGEIWEMNNDKLSHSVVNDGDEDRIHLIIDWCEKTPTEVRVNF
jgi:hypothetical protein